METIAERRLRKLKDLAKKHGGPRGIAADCDVSAATLDQIIKGVPHPPKKDGTRSARKLGDDLARRIEDHYKLGRGWFDADDLQQQSAPPAPGEDPLLDALNVIARAVEPASATAKISLVPLMSLLVNDPSKVSSIAQTMHDLLGTRSGAVQVGNNGAGTRSAFSSQLPVPPTAKANAKRVPVPKESNSSK